MKAFLLAAGLGTRLLPLTNTTPKCMLNIDGKPMIYHWIQLLERHNINDVLINTHHLPDVVGKYVEELNTWHSDLQIVLFYEEKILGSAGTIKANLDWIKDEKEFLIAYADNLTNANLSRLIQFHRSRGTILTMGLFHSDYPRGCGIAAMDGDGLIVEFVEKPENPKSDLANAGIYIASPGFLDYIPEGFVDLGHDVLPRLVGRIYGCEIEGYIRDVGTIENYRKAQKEWKKILKPW